jgi:hypothetical protein
MRSRSNLARAVKTWKISCPPGVVVSMLSRRLLNPTPRASRSGHDGDQVPERMPQPVELPDHEGVPLAQGGQGLLESGPRGLRAGHGVGEGLLAADLRKGVVLPVKVLVWRGDAGIAHEHGAVPPV